MNRRVICVLALAIVGGVQAYSAGGGESGTELSYAIGLCT